MTNKLTNCSHLLWFLSFYQQFGFKKWAGMFIREGASITNNTVQWYSCDLCFCASTIKKKISLFFKIRYFQLFLVYINPQNVYCIWPSVNSSTITSAWNVLFLKSVCEWYSEELLFSSILYASNLWMGVNPTLGTLQCRFGCNNGLAGLLYTYTQNKHFLRQLRKASFMQELLLLHYI